jgi:hypothetical protein
LDIIVFNLQQAILGGCMKNRKFIGKDGLEAVGWTIETYTSKVFDVGNPHFYAEFTYTNGHNTFNLDIESATELMNELGKFVIQGKTKEVEFKNKFKKKAKK